MHHQERGEVRVVLARGQCDKMIYTVFHPNGIGYRHRCIISTSASICVGIRYNMYRTGI